jgi:succinate dehydrogenase / fumarate reductase cytochrome b subunit
MVAWIAVTGLGLVLFLVVHLGGVGLAAVAPESFERYAAHLHSRPWLPPLEACLAAFALAHPCLALARWSVNRSAGGSPTPWRRSRREGTGGALAALAGRALPWSGGLLLLFLVIHVAQLRWHRPAAGQELAALHAVLEHPGWLALYLLAGPALALHLFHGNESAHRSLGLLDPANGSAIRRAGRVLAFLLGGGFTLVPPLLLLRASLPLLPPA